MTELHTSVEQVLEGDSTAFSEIYNNTIDTVYRTLYFLTDNKNDLDDIVQNVYVELYRSLHRFDRSRPFNSWLYGITVRQHQAYRRKKWRQARNETREKELNLTGTELDFSNAVIEKISAQDFVADVDALSYKLKQVIVLHYFNDLTQEEVSEILQIPLGTVKSRLHQALQQLRKNIRREIDV